MCGVFAALTQNRSEQEILSACTQQSHRGPDNTSIFKVDHNVFLGHNRLSIIDVDHRSNQPMSSNCGRYNISFNGEIYNFKELKSQSPTKDWKTDSDTELLLDLWIRKGMDCLDELNGMFSFIVYDNESKRLTACRDRYGIKPIYYKYTSGELLIASEINTILALDKAYQPDLQMIKTYLQLGLSEHCEHTFFDKVKRIMPGSYIVYDLYNRELHSGTWYRLEEHIENTRSLNDELIEELDTLLTDIAKLYTNSDVPIGLNLSGGTDSSLLYSYTKEINRNINCFNLDYKDYSEKEWIKEYHSGRNLHIIDDEENCVQWMNQTSRAQAEPFGGVMILAYNNLYLSVKNEGIKVILDGNGIDEVFLGYEKYLRALNKPKESILDKAIDGTTAVNRDAIGDEFKNLTAYSEENKDVSYTPRKVSINDTNITNYRED